MPRWEEMTTKEFNEFLKEDPIFVLPVGSLEGHGAHLPLGTDFFQPMQLLEELERRLPLLIAPPLLYGNCTSTGGFPGTVSISYETLKGLVGEILDNFVKNGARRILLLSGHAGRTHLCALKDAALAVVREHPEVKIWSLSDYEILYRAQERFQEVPPDDGHGGMMETSRMLAIREDLVKLERIEEKKGVGGIPRDFLIRSSPWEQFPHGYEGYPEMATKDIGRRLNSYLVEELYKMLTTPPDSKR